MWLPYTGERFMPGCDGPEIHLEHLHRYALAAAAVRGRVLDLGCGVGYGSRQLARRARRVVALDHSPAAVGYARSEHGAAAVEHLAADGRALPFPAGSFDWVICFELIEHVSEGEELLAEIRRVLAADGQLLLSTPNRPVYSEARGYQNPFHQREYDTRELRALLAEHFVRVSLFGQWLVAGSVSWKLARRSRPEELRTFPLDPQLAPSLAPLGAPTYLLALCGGGRAGAAQHQACESMIAGRLEAFLEDQQRRRDQVEATTRAQYEAVIDRLTAQLGEFDGRIRELGGEIERRHLENERRVARMSEQLAAEGAGRVEAERQREAIACELEALRVRWLEIERRSEEENAALASQRELAGQLAAEREELRQRLDEQGWRLEELGTELERVRAQGEIAGQELSRTLVDRGRLEVSVSALQREVGDRDAALGELAAKRRALEDAVAAQLEASREVQAELERLRADCDWCYRRWQEREAELEAIHRSRMWRLWMAYHALRRAVRWPLVAARRVAGRVRRGLRRLTLAALLLLPRVAGWVYLTGWAIAVSTRATAKRRTRRRPPSNPHLAAERSTFRWRPRVLIVSPYPIYPPDHGGGVRIYNLVRQLSRHCDLQLLVFIRADDDAEQRRALEPFVEKLYFHHWRPTLRPDRWGLRPRSAQLFASPEATELIRAILAGQRIDILQLEYTEMGQYGLPRFARVKAVLTEIDVTFRSRARRHRIGMHRRYTRDRVFGHSLTDWMRQLRYELQVARRADQVHVVSAADGEYLASFLPAGQRTLREVPNGVDLEHYRPPGDGVRGRRFLFIGNFDHLPNLDALDYLASEIWPQVRAQVPAAELVVIGAAVGPEVQRLSGVNGIVIEGPVADPRPYYQQCRALLAPIRAGSGTRLKILEALACGTPVITTTIGAEGLQLEAGRHLEIADEAADFASRVCRVVVDDELCGRLGREGRALVEARYGWQKSAAAALAGYAELLRDVPPPERAEPMASTSDGVDLSVIIPTCDGGEILERTLAAVARQETNRRFEIICVDSGTSPDERASSIRSGARVVTVDRAAYDHGLTRDLGASHAHGRVLVFLSQDAVPADARWLHHLTEPLFVGDGRVAVQGAMVEVPDPEARFYWDSCGGRFYFTRESRRWLESFFGIGFSTVNAAIRRDVWEHHPFGRAPIMEDKKWQREVVAAGGVIVVAPEAVVHHSHRYGVRSLVRRCASEGFGWRLLGETYSLTDMLSDMLRPGVYAELARGLPRGRVRTPAELLFPWLRPVMVYCGNRWWQGTRL